MKTFPDGRKADVMALTFGRARLIVYRDFRGIDDGW
jgi:hypothetical protein